MENQEKPDPVSVTAGILTPSEFAALTPEMQADVESVLAFGKAEHDAAWHARYRAAIRENARFFLGAPIPYDACDLAYFEDDDPPQVEIPKQTRPGGRNGDV
jgi:hypothetical protein